MKIKIPLRTIQLGGLALGLFLFTGAGLWVKRDKNYYDKLELFNSVLTTIDQNYLEEINLSPLSSCIQLQYRLHLQR